MPLELHRMTEADIPDFVRIQRLAFRNDWSRIMNPHPPTEEETKQDIEKYAKALREESDCYFVKVIDAELDGKTIACAKWRINEKERTWEEIDSQIPPAGEGISQALSDFMAFLVGSRKKWMGTKPFYFLHILVTDPEHHRRGAGGMLIKWGIEQADKAQLPTYLEASAEGRALYARFGFKEVEQHTFDMADYGGQGLEISTVMIRSPADCT